MGKKNKKGKASDADSQEMPRSVRREMLTVTNQILEKCVVGHFANKQADWNNYVDIYHAIEDLNKKQRNFVMAQENRDEHMAEFVKWVTNNGVDLKGLTVEKFNEMDYGLKTTKDLAEGELFLSIPRSIMMTSETAKLSPLGALIEQDQMLRNMPNIALVLHVLCEKATPNSFWAPYINTLPSEYPTMPLYFTPDDVQLLKGSPIQAEIIQQFRNIVRQYCYLFRLFQEWMAPAEVKLPIKNFCFEDYRWAVATVMTRQNRIPDSKANGQRMMALIPLWDMCNHCNGTITTDYSMEAESSMCYAVRPFRAEEQVLIFYGPRSNGELLLHSGFVFPSNENDNLAMKLGISKDDALFSLKTDLLSKLVLLPNRAFHLYSGEYPVDSDLLAFLRIFSMTQEELNIYLEEGRGRVRLARLREFDYIVSKANERKVWDFIGTRAQLLLRSYVTSIEDDEKSLASQPLSARAQTIAALLLSEKKILVSTVAFCRRRRQEIESLPETRTDITTADSWMAQQDNEPDDLMLMNGSVATTAATGNGDAVWMAEKSGTNSSEQQASVSSPALDLATKLEHDLTVNSETNCNGSAGVGSSGEHHGTVPQKADDMKTGKAIDNVNVKDGKSLLTSEEENVDLGGVQVNK